MTYPGGGPGGFPGQGPQQPQPGPGYGAPAGGGLKLGLPQIAYLVTAGLGVLNLFFGFASLGGETSFYEALTGWVPGLLLMSGLAALVGFLPGDAKPGPWPAILAIGAVLPFMFTVFQASGDLETGGVLVMIFGIIQMLAAVGAYLLEAGIIKMPPPGGRGPAYGQPGQYGPPPGQQQQFPPPPGQYGQPGAQTQYQPQPGQFPPPGSQHPGTPPGGYPQQQG